MKDLPKNIKIMEVFQTLLQLCVLLIFIGGLSSAAVVKGRPGGLCFVALHNSEHVSTFNYEQILLPTTRKVITELKNSSKLYFGVATFSDDAFVTFDPFDENKQGMNKHINGLEQQGNGTNVAKAISVVTDYIVNSRWQRPLDISPPIIVIVTADDPDDDQDARDAARVAQARGILLAVLGTKTMTEDGYRDIASTSEYISYFKKDGIDDEVTRTIGNLRGDIPELLDGENMTRSSYDIVIALDNSAPVAGDIFETIKNVTKELATNLTTISFSRSNRISLGLLSYSNRPRLVWRMRNLRANDSDDFLDIFEKVDKLVQQGGESRLDLALLDVDAMFNWYSSNDHQAPNLAILLVTNVTLMNDEAITAAGALKENGVPLVVVGFGEFNRLPARNIASNDNVLFTHSTDAGETVNRVINSIEGAVVLPGLDSCSDLYVDLVFVMGVSDDHLPQVVSAVADLLSSTNLNLLRVAIVAYDPGPVVVRTFKFKGSKQSLEFIIGSLSNVEGVERDAINITTTLRLLREVFEAGEVRFDAPNVVIFITDQVLEKSHMAEEVLQMTRAEGMHLVVLGVGLQVDDVAWLASDPRAVVRVTSGTLIEEGVKSSHLMLCPRICSRSSVYYKGSCFEFFTDQKMSWQNARGFCRVMGRELPVITSPDVEEFIRSTFFYWPSSFYIGLKKRSMERLLPRGQYKWVNGRPLVYTNWAPSSNETGISKQPDGSFLELCHLADLEGWHDIGCAKVTEQKTAVCVSEAGSNTIDSTVSQLEELRIDKDETNFMINGLIINSYKLDAMFQCDNGELTSRHFRCDGQRDCRDGSDEKDCETNQGDTCNFGYFRCNNGRCVSYNLVCDFWDDCGDSSDEDGCVRRECESGMYRCTNGQCIPSETKCNLIQDCIDLSDETSCTGSCPRGLSQCYDGSCIPRLWVGDGITDCAGVEREDEGVLLVKGEPVLGEALVWWYTNNSFFEDDRCLMVPDRYGRYILFKGKESLGTPSYSDIERCANSTCGQGEYKCPESYCLLSSSVCDGQQDCPLGQDEQDCDELQCQGYFRCRNTTRCLHLAQVCDGIADCPLADDERLCETRCPNIDNCETGVVKISVAERLKRLILHKVTALDVSGIKVSIPQLTFDYPLLLGYLNLSASSQKFIGKHFDAFENLIELDLSFNEMKNLRPTIFRNLRRLKKLDLSHNKDVWEIQPNAFMRNTELRLLDLSHCSVPILRASMLYGLVSVTNLDLSFNLISEIEDGSFSSMISLKLLNLKGNPVSKFTGEVFTGLANLNFLSTDNYVLCCDVVKPPSLAPDNCHAPRNSLSSCEDLLQNNVLRIFIWILGTMALVGNILVFLFRLIFDRSSLRNGCGVFLLCLSISDFFMGVYLIIIANTDLIFRGIYIWHDSTWRESLLCQTSGFLTTLSSEASAIFICLVTIDRFLVIKYPFKQIRFSKNITCVCSIFAWLIALSLSIVPLFPSTSSWQLYGQNGACLPLPLSSELLPGWQYSTSVFLGFNLVTFLLVAVGQYLIYSNMRSGSLINTKERRAQELRVARNLSLVIITDFLCWFPVCVTGLLALNGTPISGEVYAWVAVFVLPVNSAINPILYTIPVAIHFLKSKCTESRSNKEPRVEATVFRLSGDSGSKVKPNHNQDSLQ